MAAFLGMLGAGLIGPVLGMIPSAPGGPANPFAGTSAGDPLSLLLGLLGGLGGGSSGGGTAQLTPVQPPAPTYVPSPAPAPAPAATSHYVDGGGTSTMSLADLTQSPAVWAAGAVVLLLLLRK